jgi:hypothetical protein
VFILIVPITDIHDVHNRYFIPVYVASRIVAALNFIWMIIVAHRWKLPRPYQPPGLPPSAAVRSATLSK